MQHLACVNDHICRGKQPNAESFAELGEMGFKTVLDLRGGRFHVPRERKQVEAAGMHYISMRLSGIWAPKDEQISEVLGVLEDPKRWPIFVHCWRGDDRVGLVIACYRMVHDHWSNQQALAEARDLGLHRFEIFLRMYLQKFDPARVFPSTALPLPLRDGIEDEAGRYDGDPHRKRAHTTDSFVVTLDRCGR